MASNNVEVKLPANVRSFAVLKPGLDVTAYQFKPKPLGDKDLAVNVIACGICHSDVHTMLNEWEGTALGAANYPLVPGHEVIGLIVAKGSKVGDEFKIGQRVGFGPQRGSCRHCEFCEQGDEQYCDKFVGLYNPDTGGYAEHIRVDSHFAFSIPDSIESALAAPLLCAGVTVFSPMNAFKLKKGAQVAVVGIGGLGHLALQYARAFEYHVTAISSSADKSDEAKSFGAHAFISSKNKDEMKAANSSFDQIYFTGAGKINWDDYVKLLKVNGKLIVVGAPPSKLDVDPTLLILGRRSIVGSLIGGTKDINDMFAFSAKHKVFPKIELVKVGMNDTKKVNEALQKVVKNEVRYRMVLEYDTSA